MVASLRVVMSLFVELAVVVVIAPLTHWVAFFIVQSAVLQFTVAVIAFPGTGLDSTLIFTGRVNLSIDMIGFVFAVQVACFVATSLTYFSIFIVDEIISFNHTFFVH